MLKRARKPADDFKSQTLPQCDGPFIGADHKIELHGLESAFAGAIEGMRAHLASHAPAGCPGSGDVSAIGYVRAAALLIGLQKVCAHNLDVVFRDENLMPGSKPILERVITRGNVYVSPARMVGSRIAQSGSASTCGEAGRICIRHFRRARRITSI